MVGYDVNEVRKDFPVFERRVGDYPLTYLDSANTSQKPRQVVETIADFYLHHNANVARAMHQLGIEATAAYEGARARIADFVGAAGPDEIIYTRNATEALNLAANTLAGRGDGLGPGDEIVVTEMEHHSNIVPWQMVCQRTGATLRWFTVTADGQLDLEAAEREGLINERTRVVSVGWVSNVVGTVNPVRRIADAAHAVGAVMVADGAQGVPLLATDVTELGVDLLAFTGHKICGPTGIGVLYGRRELLAELPPFLGGGEMIEVVEMSGSTYADPPQRFEAGTPPIAQAIGLGAAIDYVSALGMDNIAAHERQLVEYLLGQLRNVEGVRVLGSDRADGRGGAVSFVLDDVHPHDVMQLLDSRGVAVRGGHHCARPLHTRLGIQSSIRASAYLYTTTAEIDALVEALVYTRDFFAGKFFTTGQRARRQR